jgi:hypothetical protein
VNVSATYASAAGSPIVAHTVLTGNLAVATPATPAYYEIISAKQS